MGTGASTESQGIKSEAPAPTQTELNQIVASVLANQANSGQAQYVPPQASVYTQPEASIYTPAAQTIYSPPPSQTATPSGITALLPQDQGTQTSMPTASVYTPPTASIYTPPTASVYTPPAASIYTPPAASVFTPTPPSTPVPEDMGRTMVPTQTAPATQAPLVNQNPFVAPAATAPPQTKAQEPAPTQKATEPTESDKQRAYWSNESEAFSRVMSGMESGKAQLKTRSLGADEYGNDMSELVLTTGEHPGYDTLVLRPTAQPGIYQFGTPNQVAGGTISGIIQADPEKGTYTPIQDYTKQVRYTPGQSGSFFGNMIGDFGDIYKSLGPVGAIMGNAFVPGLGSALSAVAALDEGNTTGALLSGLSAAGAYGGDAARNALAAEVSGNADLASQYSSGLGGTLAANLPEIKTATSAAQLANALDKGNLLGAISSGSDLIGTQISPEFRTGIAGLGLAQALASGNVPQAMALGSQFVGPESSGADVGPPPPPAGGISSLLPSAETPADQQVATADTSLPADTPAGLEQLVQAFTNPETTSSYTGTEVADLSGTTGLPTDQPSEQDLEQLGVGLPALTETKETPQNVEPDTTGGIDTLAQQQAELDRQAEQEHQDRIAREEKEEQDRILKVQEDELRQEQEFWRARRLAEQRRLELEEEERRREEETPEEPPVKPEEPNPVDDLEKEEQDRILKEQEDQRREEEAYWRLVQQRRLEQGEETPDVPVNTEVADDGTTGGIDDLIKTLPTGLGDFEGIDMTGGSAGETAGGTDMDDFGDFEGIDMTGGGAGTPVDDLGDFEGIDMTGGGAGEPAKDDGTGFDGIDMTGGGAGKTLGIFDQLSSATGLSPGLLKLLAGSLGLGGLGSLLGQQQQQAPAPTPYTGALSNIKMGANYTPYTYKPYAGGGAVGEMLNNDQYTMAVGYPDYASNFSPAGTAMAAGGIASLGGYSDGGRLLRGPGDGVSDSIPAVIGNKQPARLADGEFVIPARIVSELGNGSTDAGARQLYAMMDRIQAARRKTVGKDKVAANTKAAKNLPA